MVSGYFRGQWRMYTCYSTASDLAATACISLIAARAALSCKFGNPAFIGMCSLQSMLSRYRLDSQRTNFHLCTTVPSASTRYCCRSHKELILYSFYAYYLYSRESAFAYVQREIQRTSPEAGEQPAPAQVETVRHAAR